MWQAEKLREKLLGMKISKDALWVVSPMTRAMETLLLGCPHSSRIGCTDNPLKTAVREYAPFFLLGIEQRSIHYMSHLTPAYKSCYCTKFNHWPESTEFLKSCTSVYVETNCLPCLSFSGIFA